MSDPCTCSWGAPHGDPCRGTKGIVHPYGREYRAGAAVAFGLMGMAMAIRDHEMRQWALGLRPDTSRRAARDRSADR